MRLSILLFWGKWNLIEEIKTRFQLYLFLFREIYIYKERERMNEMYFTSEKLNKLYRSREKQYNLC